VSRVVFGPWPPEGSLAGRLFAVGVPLGLVGSCWVCGSQVPVLRTGVCAQHWVRERGGLDRVPCLGSETGRAGTILIDVVYPIPGEV
jgi:hypothetical protein